MERDLGKLLAQSVAAANSAWWQNFNLAYHSGDSNREAIGRLASNIFSRATSDVPPEEVRAFLSNVVVEK